MHGTIFFSVSKQHYKIACIHSVWADQRLLLVQKALIKDSLKIIIRTREISTGVFNSQYIESQTPLTTAISIQTCHWVHYDDCSAR